jgi:hypothetical protein
LLGNQTAEAGEKYLLINYCQDRINTNPSSATIMKYVAEKFGAANRKSVLKVGVACLYWSPGPNQDPFEKVALLREDLAMAQRLKVPILVQVDTETWLPPSLLNWYDASLPGYDPAKIADVEWFGWDQSTAVKLSWRNWGFPFRIGPVPNFLSANFQAYEKAIYDRFLPEVVQWYANLPANQKWLFVGWRCGVESALNGNYRFFTNGNSYYGTTNNPTWSDHFQGSSLF